MKKSLCLLLVFALCLCLLPAPRAAAERTADESGVCTNP